MAGKSAAEEPQYSAALQRIAIAGCAILFVLILLGVVHDMPGQSPLAMAATAAALVVAMLGTGWHIAVGPDSSPPPLATLTAVGLAGVVLIALLPAGTGYAGY